MSNQVGHLTLELGAAWASESTWKLPTRSVIQFCSDSGSGGNWASQVVLEKVPYVLVSHHHGRLSQVLCCDRLALYDSPRGAGGHGSGNGVMVIVSHCFPEL